VREIWLIVDDPLDDGNQEGQRLAGTRLCLRDTVVGLLSILAWVSQGTGTSTYTSFPASAGLMVLDCTSVIVSYFMP
jgi:hypothetical protein